MTGIQKMVARQAEQPHGSPDRYRAGCRCQTCVFGKRAYRRMRQVEIAAGRRNGIISAQRSREHLLAIQSRVSTDAIAEAAGLPRQRICRIRCGKQKNVREATERLILAIGVEAGTKNGLIPSAPTRFRMQVMNDAGISTRELGRKLGGNHQPTICKRPMVQAGTAQRVRVIYREFWQSLM